MLKYKINHTNNLLLSTDKRKSYLDSNILNICTFIYEQYNNRVTTISNMKKQKVNTLNNLNYTLVTKKNHYKLLLSKLSINDRNIKTYCILLDNITTKRDLSIKEFLTMIDNLKDNSLISQLKRYYYYNGIIQNLNSDIRLINTTKKEMNVLFNEYANINTNYSNDAKITLYDIDSIKRGIITPHIKEVMYYYYSAFKKCKGNVINLDNDFKHINNLNRIVFNNDKLNLMIQNSIKSSLNDYTIKSITERVENLKIQILTKWI